MTRARLQEIAGLARRKERARLGQFLVEGVRSVEAAVAAGAPLVEVLVAVEAADEPRVAALLAGAEVPVHRLPARDLARVSDAQHGQGLVAVARSVTVDLGADPHAFEAAHRIVALDGVQDPGNVGTVIRTAAWFGAEAVLAGAGTADLESPKVVRSAMGGLWDVRLARTDDLSAALVVLRALGFAVQGADLDGVPLVEWASPERGVLVLGSEAQGLSDAVRARLDARVAISGGEGTSGVESLNVGVAAGILLHHWRHASGGR